MSVLVEKKLDAFIERRHEQRVRTEGERDAEMMWRESERRFRERQRREVRALWYAYFCRIADSLRSRAEEYDRRAERLLEEDGRKETP